MAPLTITTIVQREMTTSSISDRFRRALDTARDAQVYGEKVSFHGAEMIPKTEIYEALSTVMRYEVLDQVKTEIDDLSWRFDSSKVNLADVLNKYFTNPNGYFKE